MRTHNIPPCYRKIKEILIMPPDLLLLSTPIGSNYPCLELIFMVPKVFEPLKFDCILFVTAGFLLQYFLQQWLQLNLQCHFNVQELGWEDLQSRLVQNKATDVQDHQ